MKYNRTLNNKMIIPAIVVLAITASYIITVLTIILCSEKVIEFNYINFRNIILVSYIFLFISTVLLILGKIHESLKKKLDSEQKQDSKNVNIKETEVDEQHIQLNGDNIQSTEELVPASSSDIQSSCDDIKEEPASKEYQLPEQMQLVNSFSSFDCDELSSDLERIISSKVGILQRMKCCESEVEVCKQCIYKEMDKKQRIIDSLLEKFDSNSNLKELLKNCQDLYKDYCDVRKKYYESYITHMKESTTCCTEHISEFNSRSFDEKYNSQLKVICNLRDQSHEIYEKLQNAGDQLRNALKSKNVTQSIIDQWEEYANYGYFTSCNFTLNNKFISEDICIKKLSNLVSQEKDIIKKQQSVKNVTFIADVINQNATQSVSV
ncbi:hypothetical protein K6025_02705 [Ehrlichia sp. JZT12]